MTDAISRAENKIIKSFIYFTAKQLALPPMQVVFLRLPPNCEKFSFLASRSK